MGYRAMAQYTSWNGQTEKECGDKQAAELFDLVVTTARDGGKVNIRRNHIFGTVTASIDGTFHRTRGGSICYYLQREMTEAEIMEESIKSGMWVERRCAGQ